MTNRAFGFWSGLNSAGSNHELTFQYVVMSPSNVGVHTATASVTVDYSDSPYGIWSKLVDAIRLIESDSTLEVIGVPASLEALMYQKTY